jgi:uncharacterized protein YaiI (UPF0178 family)
MQIWIDADACPVVIKEILYKAADRRQVLVTLVANQALSTPPSAFIKAIQVSSGFDVADDEIVRLLHTLGSGGHQQGCSSANSSRRVA